MMQMFIARAKFGFGLRRAFRVAAAALAASACCHAVAQPAAIDTSAVPPKAALCESCHGASGQPTLQPAYPILSGQTARYLTLQLRDFQAGRRVNEVMSPMAAGLTAEEMRALANYFAKQKPPRQVFAADSAKVTLGKAKAEETLCTMCHLGGFKGQNEVPWVGGQNHDYIAKQLADFKAKRRTNDAGTMSSVAATLSEQDIENLAQYLVGL